MPGRPSQPTTKPRRQRPQVPSFALYGESRAHSERADQHELSSDVLHIEPIQSRSRLYRWEIDAHTHQGLYQVIWLASGPARVNLDETSTTHEGPVAVVIPPGVVHAFRFAAQSQGVVLTLSPQVWLEGEGPGQGTSLARLFEHARVLSWPAQAPEVARIDGLIGQLAAEFTAPDVAASPLPVWLARAVLWRLAQAAPQGDAARPRQSGQRQAMLTRFQTLVEAHFLQHWPVSRYASALGLSAERLNRLVQAEAGCNALTWVHRRLVREACRRLAYVAAPVTRLADELGFEDAAYFSRFFKRHTGMSPRQWREQQTHG